MLTDERYKQLMEQVGMPNSRSLLLALQQCAMESALLEREKYIKNTDSPEMVEVPEHWVVQHRSGKLEVFDMSPPEGCGFLVIHHPAQRVERVKG